MSIVLQFHRRCHVFRRCRLNHQRSRDDPPPCPTITNKNSSISTSSSNNNTAISRLTLLPRRCLPLSSCTRTRLAKAPQTISPSMFCTNHHCCTLHAFLLSGKILTGKQPRRRTPSLILRQLTTTTGNSDNYDSLLHHHLPTNCT